MRLIVVSRAHAVSVALLVASLAAAPATAQTDEQRGAARELALEGIAAYEAGKDSRAVDLLNRAQTLVNAPTHLLYMGRAYARMGQYVRAREAYHRILRDSLPPGAPRAFADARAAAESEIGGVEGKISRLTIRLENAPDDLATAVVRLDGTPVPSVLLGVPQPVDPGEHRIEASAPRLRAETKRIALAPKQNGEVVLQLVPDGSAKRASVPAASALGAQSEPLKPPATPSPVHDSGSDGGSSSLRIVGYGALGLGAIGAGVGSVFLLRANGKRSDADAICQQGGGVCPSERRGEIRALDDDADEAMILSVVSYSVAGASIATGVALLLVGTSDQKSASIAPFVTLDRVGVLGRF